MLYDLACSNGLCFSLVVWRIRLQLNYKQIPDKTIFLEFPDIEPTLKACKLRLITSRHRFASILFQLPGPGLTSRERTSTSFPMALNPSKSTVPAIHHVRSNTYMMDSTPIAQFIESTYQTLSVSLKSELGREIEANARTDL